MSQAELMALPQPAMANILRYMDLEVGCSLYQYRSDHFHHWFAGCHGRYLPVETTLLMSRDGILPKVGAKVNRKQAPSYSLFITAALTNVFLLTFLVTDYAYQFAYSMCYRSDFDLLLARGDLSNDLFLSAKDNKQLFIGAVVTAFQIIWDHISRLCLCFSYAASPIYQDSISTYGRVKKATIKSAIGKKIVMAVVV